MSEIAYLSWLEAAQRIRARALSPLDYTRALLERIHRHDPQLNAFLRLREEGALAEAEAAERKLDSGDPLGPLHGVPYALKDIIDVAGLPTTAHSKILLDNLAHEDAAVSARLRAAGGILLGKLATHEFAIGGPCFDLPWPPARNPWDRGRMPGGSSSGSGAAVAAGLVPLALGSDTGGSVRNPASACSIVGMKPTYGRVSRRGVVPLSYSLDTLGPLTRTVAENAALLHVIAGHDPQDPASSAASVPDFGIDLERGIEGLEVGVLRHFHGEDLEAQASIVTAFEAALETLASLGARVREVRARPLRDYASANRVVLTSEAYAIHEQWLRERPEDYAALTRERLLVGAFFRAADYVKALRLRRRLAAQMSELLASVDVLVCLSSFDPPPPIDDPEAIAKTYPRQARTPFNITGHPAVSIPCGFSDDGLPIGLQIAGAAFDEVMVYRVAAAYERASPWKDRHPKLG